MTAADGPPGSEDAHSSGVEWAVEIAGVCKAFAGQPVLDHIDLKVGAGSFTSILGPSGCGKSTLLRLIAGLERPDAGSIRVVGGIPDDARRHHRVAMAFQDPSLFEWRDTEANIELPMRLAGWDESRRRERVTELLEMVGLGGVGAHKVWELSGGMQQRVALARALALGPSVVLLDEPFGALDELTRERLHGEVYRLQRSIQSTIVMVTHSVSEAVALGDQTVVMAADPGRIVAHIDTGLVDIEELNRDSSATLSKQTELEIRARSALKSGAIDTMGTR